MTSGQKKNKPEKQSVFCDTFLRWIQETTFRDKIKKWVFFFFYVGEYVIHPFQSSSSVAASTVIAGAQPSGTLLPLSDLAHLEASTTNIAAAGFAASNENPSTS